MVGGELEGPVERTKSFLAGEEYSWAREEEDILLHEPKRREKIGPYSLEDSG